MRRFLRLICLLAVAALLPAALLVSRGLPVDSRPYVAERYAGWNGVLRAWVCARWDCAGGFVRWLNARAAEFEKRHDGVYIEFTPVEADALRALGGDGLRPPELVLFSPGAPVDPAKLVPIEAPDALREELRDVGAGFAYPVAMGGYIWAYNRQLAAGAPAAGDAFAAPGDDVAHSYSAAAVALLSDPPGDDGGEELPDAGLDLGLPASAMYAEAGDALERFIDGELPCVALTQAELARLIRLHDAGRGPDWACAPAGRSAYTDQLLLLAVPAQGGGEADSRRALAEEFGAELLSSDAQAGLADIGAFSVTGMRVYDDLSPYAALDALLNGRELLTPASAWARLPACGELLRGLASGGVDSTAALEQLRALLR